MGEKVELFRASFNRSVIVEAREANQSSDGGLLLIREVLERAGLDDFLTNRLHDPRDPNRITHGLAEQLRTVIGLLAQGWGDLDDVEGQAPDPLLALTSSSNRGLTALDQTLPSQPTLSRLLGNLAEEPNRSVLHEAVLRLAGNRLRAANGGHRHRYMTLDFDGLSIPVAGHQAGSAYNGYLGGRVYYPLVASIAETGDQIDARLREGNAHPAAEAPTWIPDVVDQARQHLCQVGLARIDAGFADDTTLSALEDRGVPYVARLPGNKALDRKAEPYLKRPVGRPTKEPREWPIEERYQAGSWASDRRVILVVQERPDDLFFDTFWLVTSLEPGPYPAEEVLRLYRRRGKAEAHMGELKDVLEPRLSSTSRGTATEDEVFARNEAWLLLHLLAYEAMHALRVPLEETSGQGFSLKRLREQVLKTATRLLVHARQIRVVM
ncbi:MAG: IS1380 family transposase, partial [Thiohalorhabdaceae bacterium]